MSKTYEIQGKHDVYKVTAKVATLRNEDIMYMKADIQMRLGLDETRICPHCENHLKENDEVVSLDSDDILFPYTIIHKECFEKEDIAEQCKKLNKKYMEFIKMNKFWRIH